MGALNDDLTAPRDPGPYPTDEQGRGSALDPVLEELRSHVDRPAAREAFAGFVLRRIPLDQVGEADPVTLARALNGAFDFADGRTPDEIRVRLADPPMTIDGWSPTGTVVDVSCDDRQFIVTTFTEELHRLGHRVARMTHPVYGAVRDDQRRLTGVGPARSAARRESFLQAELAGIVPAGARADLEEALAAVLGDVFAATGDYAAMSAVVVATTADVRRFAARRYPPEDVAETAAFLEWLGHGNFVFAGCCRLGGEPTRPEGLDGSAPPDLALGVLARPDAILRTVPPDHDGQLLHISRTAELSRVHRQVPMHRIDVAEVDGDGARTGTFRLVGVFSHRAAAEAAVATPVLRSKLRRVLELEDVVEGSHDEETLISLFQSLPKEELFESDVAELRATLVGLLAAELQGTVRALLRTQPLSHTVAALIAVPQERYHSTLRRRLERFLMAQLDGTRVDSHLALGDGADAIIRLVVHVADLPPEKSLDALERELRILCRTWDEELGAALAARLGEGPARRMGPTWASWFPQSYRDAVAIEDAVDDIVELERLMAQSNMESGPDDPDTPPGASAIRIRATAGSGRPALARIRVLSAGAPIALSAFLPILESLGLWVVEERPYPLGPGEHRAHLHDFGVTDRSGAALDIALDGGRLAEAALALWHGRAEIDGLNRLVLRGAMAWGDVAVLRAYRRYRSQVGTTFTTSYVDDVLVEHPGVARGLLDLFAARFDPVGGADPGTIEERRNQVLADCERVARLDHDRILRGMLALVDATLRTNRYISDSPNIALKFDTSLVPDAPRPVPYREIFVHGPSMEGVHLRWGPVARGGIRWSERSDDYRSEVLDLMRAQVLKNAVIVPTGAKGGFVVKNGGRARESDAVLAAYVAFIGGLLDVTDNLVANRVVAVPRRADGDDPYLVVAADRGTAAFSDVANALAAERGFWLGDAFASGGSKGFNHKELGVTARGAWVSARHHFGELDLDLDADPITVVGIGDLSGDVFGNAMLRSDRIRLVAAFDHRDIFIDPDPDPTASYGERARLFGLRGSSWQDYDRAVLSDGGGVWSRLEKRIPLSAQARGVLGVDAENLSPPELIRAILQAPVSLLFAGGIGTFVRASTEPDSTVDDRANAEVRVEGRAIRARVVVEGANLAFTQRARIEYARRGGHINTDAIDNSAGVDTSDHEVNLKILLRLAVEGGEISADERDELLQAASADVVQAVLHDNLLQNSALSQAQADSPGQLDSLAALAASLEAAGFVDRAAEALPTDAEMNTRAGAGAGLTRPELAVLMAATKRSLASELLASDLPDQGALRPALVSYFPAPLASRFDHHLDNHRLRRELVAAVVANDVVDRMGPTFVSRLTERGHSAHGVVAAYLTAGAVAGAEVLWPPIDRAGTAAGARVSLVRLLAALASDYLRQSDGTPISAVIERDRPAFIEIAAAVPDMGTDQQRRRRARRATDLMNSGLDTDTAVCWACLDDLEIVPDVAEIARAGGRTASDVADTFVGLADALDLDRISERLAATPASDKWQQQARQGLIDDVDDLRRRAARVALAEAPDLGPADTMDRFLAARTELMDAAKAAIRDLERETEPRLDALAVVTRAVRQVIDATSAAPGP